MSLPLWPEGVRCETCRHWKGPSVTVPTGKMPCALLSTARSGDDQPPHIYVDYSADVVATLEVPPSFACNQWEAR